MYLDHGKGTNTLIIERERRKIPERSSIVCVYIASSAIFTDAKITFKIKIKSIL